jgi:hypothetical protein
VHFDNHQRASGSGKTALAINFATKCGRPFVWYKVDAPESELRIFFHYLVASIRRQRPRFGEFSVAPNGLHFAGVTGIVMTGADGIVMTGADGIVVTGADGIVMTGADSVRSG